MIREVKKVFFLILLFSNLSFSYDLDQIPKSKAIWTDFVVQLNHQISLMAGFSRINNYLCIFRDTNYTVNSNLQNPITSSEIGYKAILDDVNCGTAKQTSPWVVKSGQNSNVAPLIIEIFNPSENTDVRAKIEVHEEASAANPYGKILLDYFVTTKPHADPLYLAKYDSSNTESWPIQQSTLFPDYLFDTIRQYPPPINSSPWISSAIRFDTAILVDSFLIDPTAGSVGLSHEFYGSMITHVPNIGGVGIVHTRIFTGSSYPDGVPSLAKRTRFAYDNDYVRYDEQYTYDMVNWSRNQVPGESFNSFRCLKRDENESWNYVPSWFGYGIYDSNGDRLTGNNLNISANYTGIIQTSLEAFNGSVIINSGSSITVGWACKKVKDGSHFNNNDLCPSTIAGQVHAPQTINGEEYENFPLLDIPDETVLVDNNGNEYYVRHLRPRIVYAEYGYSDCNHLEFQNHSSMPVPEHTFFDYPILTMPNSGAVLVNKLSSKPSEDFISDIPGAFYSKSGDSDNDGVPNLIDAFPINGNKTDNEGLYSTNNHFQPITDGPLPKYLDRVFVPLPAD